jgi:predicted nucleotide-binding protein
MRPLCQWTSDSENSRAEMSFDRAVFAWVDQSVIRPSVFIGSSSEGVEFARAVRAALEDAAEITIWEEGVFEIGQTFVESLINALSRFDFAVLVLPPDDLVHARSTDVPGPRDNVIFELGLFMGRLGRGRTFILQPSAGIKVPSDLSGVTTASYYWPRSDGSCRSAVATACDMIRERIRCLGPRNKQDNAEISGGLDLARVKEDDGVLWTVINGCEIRVINGRIEDHPVEATTAVVLPCNEYFDDRCAFDTKSALGAYANMVFTGQINDFIACSRDECIRRLGAGVEQQKTADERALSFGPGRAVLLLNPLGRDIPIALVSTTTQRAGQGLAAKSSYLFDGVCELVTRLVDARLRDVVMPILGAGHGRIEPSVAFVTLALAIGEALRSMPGGSPLRTATIVVFQKDAKDPPQVHRTVVKRALALIASSER